jgi:hypothetical protein
VGDHHQLALAPQPLEDLAEAAHVGVVQGRIHLVEDREGRRVDGLQRQHQRQRRQRALTGAQERDVLHPLARWLHQDLDPAARPLVAGGVLEGGATARGQLPEVLQEVGCHGAEDGLVAALLLLSQPPDQLLQVGPGRRDVVQL